MFFFEKKVIYVREDLLDLKNLLKRERKNQILWFFFLKKI